MGTDVEATETDIQVARNGIRAQLVNTKLIEMFGDLDSAITALGMEEFIENEARVIAQERAYTRMLSNKVHLT